MNSKIKQPKRQYIQQAFHYLSPYTEPFWIDSFQQKWYQFRGDQQSYYIQVLFVNNINRIPSNQ